MIFASVFDVRLLLSVLFVIVVLAVISYIRRS
jgi:hypothetical protein